MALKENYVDDILNTSKNTKRKYNMITNADGTVSFEDVTEYSQNGDSFGANDVNAITERVNRSLTGDDVVDNLESTETKLPLSANKGREVNENLSNIMTIDTTEKIVGTWDGKPIYERLFRGWMYSGENSTKISDSYNNTNIQLIDAIGEIELSSGTKMQFGVYMNADNYNGLYVGTSGLLIYHSTGCTYYRVTLKYVKL